MKQNAGLFRGERGESAVGARGERGEKGERGLPGANGRDGKDGAPGRAGKDGLPGRDGANGRDLAPVSDEEFRGRLGDVLRGGLRLGYSVSGPPGPAGVAGPPGTTNYNDLLNLPTLGSVASTAASLYTLVADTGTAASTAASTYALAANIGTAASTAASTYALAANIGTAASTAASTYARAADIVGATYTPSLTNVANLDGSTTFSFQYTLVNNMVTVSGRVQVDPTAPAAVTGLGIALPIASDFQASSDCGGVAFATNIAGQGAGIVADTVNNRALMQFVSTDLTAQPMAVMFQYQVL